MTKIILSNHPHTSVPDDKCTYVSSPQQALDYLIGKGYDKALVAGGSEINSAFMKAGLIDEVRISVEPYILGNGIPLFKQGDFEKKLQYIDQRKISNSILQLHYKVVNR